MIMGTFKKTEELKREHEIAAHYVGLLSRPQPHFDGSPVGKLSAIKVETEICHQASPAAQNYWKSAHFDKALSMVISERFKELAAQALDKLKQGVNQSLIAEEDELLARLAEIRALKAQTSKEAGHAST